MSASSVCGVIVPVTASDRCPWNLRSAALSRGPTIPSIGPIYSSRASSAICTRRTIEANRLVRPDSVFGTGSTAAARSVGENNGEG